MVNESDPCLDGSVLIDSLDYLHFIGTAANPCRNKFSNTRNINIIE